MSNVMFMHIEKTAGTSLRHMLAKQYVREAIMPVPLDWGTADGCIYPTSDNYYADILPRMDESYGNGYKLIMGHYDWSHVQRISSKWKVFTFFRDPVERFISHFYFIRDRAIDSPLHSQLRGVSLESFISSKLARQEFGVKQCLWMSGDPDAPLTADGFSRALNNLHKLDTIGIVEDMSNSIKLLEATYGYHFNTHLHENPTPRPETLSDVARDEIEFICRHDYVLYNTAKDIYQQMLQERLNVTSL